MTGEDVCGPESECVHGVLFHYEGEDRGYDLYLAAQEFPGIVPYIQLQIPCADWRGAPITPVEYAMNAQMTCNLVFLLQNGADDSILANMRMTFGTSYLHCGPITEHHNTIDNAISWYNGVKKPNNGWRPNNHKKYPTEYRDTMKTLVLLAKAKYT